MADVSRQVAFQDGAPLRSAPLRPAAALRGEAVCMCVFVSVCAPGERLPLRRQHRCLLSGKKPAETILSFKSEGHHLQIKNRDACEQDGVVFSPSAFVFLSLRIFCGRWERFGLLASLGSETFRTR
ncbi:hypothetical protein XENOCAPTIV_005565 [Xenoophorus captivus]|uniref:Uncharacterized protein n=1 Tax=Xenoophorus captivus TaxID=1517983 RepID=A0ABV0QR05_9TELE